jgi:hypothetical protein
VGDLEGRPLELRVKLDVGIAGLMHALNPQGKHGQR